MIDLPKAAHFELYVEDDPQPIGDVVYAVNLKWELAATLREAGVVNMLSLNANEKRIIHKAIENFNQRHAKMGVRIALKEVDAESS